MDDMLLGVVNHIDFSNRPCFIGWELVTELGRPKALLDPRHQFSGYR